MDNQHRKISGYRELSQGEVDLVNAVKAQEKAFLALVETQTDWSYLQTQDAIKAKNAGDSTEIQRLSKAEPGRWASIAKTHIQEGASALVRAITQPT